MAKRVLIVGAGVTGLSTAYYCLRRGHRVTILDRAGERHEGCSFGNAGMIVPSHFIPLAAPGAVQRALRWMFSAESPFCIKPRLSWDLLAWGIRYCRAATRHHVHAAAPLLRDLHLASRACYEELSGLSSRDFELTRLGLMMLCKTRHALDEEEAAAAYARQLGIAARTLRPQDAAELEPRVKLDIIGGVYYPGDCYLAPARFMRFLSEQLRGAGAEFCWNCDLDRWRVRGSRICSARVKGGELSADEFVVCAGAWSAKLLRPLQINLPLQGGKGYSLTLPRPRALPRICSILTEARVAVTPIQSALRFAGTMEIGAQDLQIDARRLRGIIKSIPAYMPEFRGEDFDGIVPWAGLRPCSPDGLPYIGRTRRFANLSIASGHAMMGMSLGPITGKLISEIVSDERPQLDISMLGPDRYS